MRLAFMVMMGLALAAPAGAQEPGVDEEGCKESALLSRMPGCGIYECSTKEFDAAEVVVNMAGDTRRLEGQVEILALICPEKGSPLQLQRNAEAALRKAGYTVVFTGAHDGHSYPAVTAHKGAQWVSVQAGMYNEFPQYTQTAVLVQAMAQEMTAAAKQMADALAGSGRVDVYGITFATGQATLTSESEAVLADVVAVLQATPDLRLRVEGHTDNVGDTAANQKLSEARAAAVVAWLTARGIDAGRLVAAGFGDTQPVADNATPEGRAKNRRVTLARQ
ncbi:MAG: OmpA family protein [Acidobacteriota bacterium]